MLKKFLPAFLVLTALVGLIVIGFNWINSNPSNSLASPGASKTISNQAISPQAKVKPQLQLDTIVEGLSNPWDLQFANIDTLLFTQRQGGLFKKVASAAISLVHRPVDLNANGEGGMLGLVLGPDFANKRELFTCFNSRQTDKPDIKVVKLKLNASLDAVEERNDIITDLPANRSGRHSGCRLAVDTQANLWVATGDAAMASTPQDPKSLGGKILRVDLNGKAVVGNLPAPFDPRIFSYGHRNSQGLIIFDEPIAGSYGFSSEHGSNIDDEINPLLPGNFGWSPNAPYVENVPMTDTKRFPEAITALWSSGSPTVAVSGMTMLKGRQWGMWENGIMLAVQKNRHIRLFTQGEVSNGVIPQLIDNGPVISDHGRIRTVVPGPSGAVYFLTDNGNGQDKIIRITPE